jgi:hypothetical protein
LHRSGERRWGGGGAGEGRTAVECAVDLGEVHARVGHALEVVDDIVPGRLEAATVAAVGRKVLDEPAGRSARVAGRARDTPYALRYRLLEILRGEHARRRRRGGRCEDGEHGEDQNVHGGV